MTHVNDSTPPLNGTSTRVDYHAYLASREWALVKKQVRERSGGLCERCGAPQDATHHLTYERLGRERLDDLQAVCKPCHEYLSALRDDDPAAAPLDVVDVGVYLTIPRGVDDAACTRIWDAVSAILRQAEAADGMPVYLMCFGLMLKADVGVWLSGPLWADLRVLLGERNVVTVYSDGSRD